MEAKVINRKLHSQRKPIRLNEFQLCSCVLAGHHYFKGKVDTLLFLENPALVFKAGFFYGINFTFAQTLIQCMYLSLVVLQ